MNFKNIIKGLWGRIKNVLMCRALLYVIFWSVIFIQSLSYLSSNTLNIRSILTAFCIIGFYAIPISIEAFFLIERYFKKRKYSLYFLFLALVIATNSVIASYVLREVAGIYIIFIQHVFNTAGSLVIVSILRLYKNNIEQQVEFQELQSRQVQSELSVLKSQIHPHFLFNTLNSIYSLALTQSEKTAEVVLKLSDLMRYTLHKSQEQLVPLSFEIEYLQNYLWLEQLRLGARADIMLDVEGDTNKFIAPMLFLPFVENSFKHGVDQSTGKVFVRIKIIVNGKGLCFKIENNKPEKVLKSSLDTASGIGLANVERRLSILYPGKHQLEREVKLDVYKVTLKLYW
jgi:LytS/YehU family sensor histidine kinase